MQRANILTIAGSDSGGGAGIQADLKTIMALGGYGMSVITALTAQNGLRVAGIHAPEPEFVVLELTTVLEGFPIQAAKTGYTAQAAVEAVNYYGGMVAGLSAIFATTTACAGIPVTSIFDPSSLPDYASYDSRECPLCKAGQHIDALVNSFGYSAL